MENVLRSFVPRSKFVLDQHINWFPRHMNRGIRDIGKRLKNVDCILEVHDARIPFSGRNIHLLRRMASLKPIVLLLNKIDLVPKPLLPAIEKRLRDQTDAHYVPVKQIFFLNSRDSIGFNKQVLASVLENVKDKFQYNEMIMDRHANLLVMGIPNVGKSTIINRFRNIYLGKSGEATQTGNRPGVTKRVLEKIKICDHPHKLYLYDTPGIIEPPFQGEMKTQAQREAYLKCALCGNILDNIVDIELVADYLLFVLNREHNFSYVKLSNAPGPTNDIREVLAYIAIKSNMTHRFKSLESQELQTAFDFRQAAERFLRLFREGKLGPICLDSDHVDGGKSDSSLA